ncbi:MAG: sigma-54 dependent transcriptional regulator [Pseudomonadota bacterium]
MSDSSQSKVLVLDTDKERAAELCNRLKFLKYEPVLSDPDDAIASIKNNSDGIAVVLGDTGGPEDNRILAERLTLTRPGLPVIHLNTDPDVRFAETEWFLDVPLKRSQMQRLLDRAARYSGSDRRHRLSGESHPIRKVRTLIEKVADFDTNVLVTGQSGTGKELVARTIHDLSHRADQPFVPINCGAIPAELLESELFGHKKGAFTGAVADRTGRFELADGGTLFLDEIGDMSLDMQVKLLRVLQERSFEKVGSNTSQACDVRIVAATHRDLPAMVEAGEFRQDLYYRLNVYPIEMPPLYKRATDLPCLMNELLVRHTGSDSDGIRISPEALRVLAAYRWPGNVRELGNLVERLAIIKPEGTVDVADLPPKYTDPDNQVAISEAPNMVAEAMQLSNDNLKDHLCSVEKQLIQQAMQASNSVVAQAARLLNMRRTTLVEKLAKYELA